MQAPKQSAANESRLRKGSSCVLAVVERSCARLGTVIAAQQNQRIVTQFVRGTNMIKQLAELIVHVFQDAVIQLPLC